MYYREFKTASKKHLKTCECLTNNFFDNSNFLECKKNKKYILETIIKYAIFVSINYERDKHIEDVNQDGIIYTKDSIQSHNLMKLKRFLDSKNIGIINYENNKRLYNKWDSTIRYKEMNFSESDILNFFSFSREVYKDLAKY